MGVVRAKGELWLRVVEVWCMACVLLEEVVEEEEQCLPQCPQLGQSGNPCKHSTVQVNADVEEPDRISVSSQIMCTRMQ